MSQSTTTRSTSSPVPDPASAKRTWRVNWLAFIAGLVAWLGMLVLCYPMVASWVSQLNQSKVVTNYDTQSQSKNLVPSAAEQLAAAHRYNDALNSGGFVIPGQRIPSGNETGTETSSEYNSLLRVDDSGMMGRIQIPSIQVDLPIYHGTSDETLLRGIGHLEGTSLPVGGAGTHTVLTGHRGLASATMFTNLNQVKVGDTFSLTVLGQTITYRVTSTAVVNPDQTESLRPVAGKDLATLVTCTPLGINTQRILVTGERVIPTPTKDVAAANKKPDVPSFPWWAFIIGGGTGVIVIYEWRSGMPPKPRPGTPEAGPAPE